MFNGLFRLSFLIVGAITYLAAVTANATVVTALPSLTEENHSKRLALIVGNAAYTALPALTNTVPDAKAVASAAQGLGYRVFLVENADRLGMNQAISDFLTQVEADSEVLFYYAGHGVELSGANYLFPVDVPMLKMTDDRLLRSEAINLSDLLLDFESRAARVTLVILDACRDNPFAKPGTRSLGSTRGLARVDPPSGTFVIFAAGAGETALDSLGTGDTEKNGVFTRVLLKHIGKPGVELRSMVRELRQEVRQIALSNAHHSQTPSYYDQLLGDFYFSAAGEDNAPEPACETLVKPNASRKDVLFRDYTSIVNTCELALLQSPGDAKLENLVQLAKEQQAFQKALAGDSPAFAEAYLSVFPEGRYLEEVRDHLATLNSGNAASQPVAIDIATLSRSIQTELQRTGCYVGTVDGVWGGMSRKAVAAFAKYAKIETEGQEPNEDLLAALRNQRQRVCPLVCGAREDVKNGVCVQKTCLSGQVLTNRGACVARQVRETTKTTKRATSQARKSPRAGCFTFNGATHCD